MIIPTYSIIFLYIPIIKGTYSEVLGRGSRSFPNTQKNKTREHSWRSVDLLET